MKLSTRVLLSTLVVSGLFAILLLALLIQYTHNVQVASSYVEQTQPAREAIEHLLTTVYDDFLLVEQYLLVTNYSELSQYENRLTHSQEQCEVITDEIDDLITLEVVTNNEVIKSYQTAVLVYSSWERSRNSLLDMHKEYVATKRVRKSEILEERARFVQLMRNSTGLFAQSLAQLNEHQQVIQQDLDRRTQTTQYLLLILLIVFISGSTLSATLLIRRLTAPLDQIAQTSAEFTKGDYTVRVPETSPVVELQGLQQQLNRVYSLIDKTFTTKDEKTKADQHLLPSQYKEILEFIRSEAVKGKTPTIKDVKKAFSLTHPTVISRLQYLSQNGYIVMKKHGRQKCIFEV